MAKAYIDVNTHTETILNALRHGGLLLTTKAGDKVNSMVIGWGTIGVNWGKPVFAVYVRKGTAAKQSHNSNDPPAKPGDHYCYENHMMTSY